MLIRMPFPYSVVASVLVASLACGDADPAPESRAVAGDPAPGGHELSSAQPAPTDGVDASQTFQNRAAPQTAADTSAVSDPRGTSAAAATGADGAPVAFGGGRASSLSEGPVESRSEPTAAKAEPPRLREVTLPAGTTLTVRLTSDVSSDGSQVEDRVGADVTKPVIIDGITAVAEGADLSGTVLDVRQPGRVRGRAAVAFRFDRLTVHGSRYDIRTDRISRVAPATKGQDAKKVGIGAGAGAVIGAIAGGKKGAAIGGAVGAGGGTGVVLATRGQEVRVLAGSIVRAKLLSPVTVRVPERE